MHERGVVALEPGIWRAYDSEEGTVAKDHGPTVKNDKQYEGLREKGMSKSRAAAISNSPGASSTGGKSSGTQCHEMTSRA